MMVVLDRRIHEDAPYPTLEGACVPELIQVLKQPDKAFLNHILCLHIVYSIPPAQIQHFWCKVLKYRFLRSPVAFLALADDIRIIQILLLSELKTPKSRNTLPETP